MSCDKAININNKTKNRELWVDIVKGIAIILIIYGHTFNPADFIVGAVSTFNLPLFFVIAGYLFNFSRYQNNLETFFFNSVRRLLLPYFFTLFLYYIYWLITENHDLLIRGIILKQMIIGWLYSCGNVIKPSMDIIPCGVLWFLTALFLARFLLFFVLKIFEKLKLKLMTKFLILFFIAYIGYFIGKFIFLPWSIDIVLVAIFFMFFGYSIRQNYFEKIENNIILFIWLILIWINELYAGTNPFNFNNRYYGILLLSLLGACSVSYLIICISKLIEKKCPDFIKNFLSYCGKYSLIILIFHAADVGYFHFDLFIPHYKEIIMSNYYYLFLFRLIFSIFCIEFIKILPIVSEIYIGISPIYYKFFNKTKIQ